MSKGKARIVSATGASATVRGNKRVSALLEEAMRQAVLKANEDGVTDAKEIKARMMAAHEQAKKDAGLE